MLGIVFGLLAGASYAFYTVFGVRFARQGEQPTHVLAASFAVSGVILVPVFLLSGTWWMSWSSILLILWLGLATREHPQQTAPVAAHGAVDGGTLFRQGLLSAVSNPKAVLFFAAFFPQFLNPAAPMAPQFTILALTFMAFEFAVLTTCALSVSRLAPLLRQSGPIRWVNRICGGLFTLMGGLLLFTRRSA